MRIRGLWVDLSNCSEAGRKGLVLLRAVAGACCGVWGCQEMVGAFGSLTAPHGVDTYPVLHFPACSPVWSRGDELSPGAGTNPAGALSFLCDH